MRRKCSTMSLSRCLRTKLSLRTLVLSLLIGSTLIILLRTRPKNKTDTFLARKSDHIKDYPDFSNVGPANREQHNDFDDHKAIPPPLSLVRSSSSSSTKSTSTSSSKRPQKEEDYGEEIILSREEAIKIYNRERLRPENGSVISPPKLPSDIEEIFLKNLERMEQKQLAEVRKEEIDRLPKPKEVIQRAKGPAVGLEPDSPERTVQTKLASLLQNAPLKFKDAQLRVVVIVPEGGGYGVLEEAFNNQNGVFHHVEPIRNMTDEQAMYAIENLFHCSLTDVDFPRYIEGTLGRNDFVRNVCQDQPVCLQSPVVIEKLCSQFPVRIVKSSELRVEQTRRILIKIPDVFVVSMTRDPRGIFGRTRSSSGLDQKQLCKKFAEDYSESTRLVHAEEKNFRLVRYEDMAVSPKKQMEILIEAMGVKGDIVGDGVSEKSGWNLDNNPVEKVNSWKQRLKLEEINSIEADCLDILNKLEYPILGE